MSYRNTNSSDTDDDPPRKSYSRMGRSGNGRNTQQASYAGGSYERGHVATRPSSPQIDFVLELKKMEETAYSEILRVFAAQDSAITWEKEELLSNLRKELHITEETHRAMVKKVSASEIVVAIRSWKKEELINHASKDFGWREQQPPSSMEAVSPGMPQRKRQKMASLLPQQQPPPALHPPTKQQIQPPPLAQTPMPPPAPRGRTGPLTKGGRKSGRGGRSRGGEVEEHLPPPSQVAGKRKEPPRDQIPPNNTVKIHPYIGKLVETYWPDNGGWCKAVVADYKSEGATELFCLIYDMNTEQESFEWVDLAKMNQKEYRFLDEEPVLLHQRMPTTSVGGGARGGRGGGGMGRSGRVGSGRGGLGRGAMVSPAAGKGRGGQFKPPPPQHDDDAPPTSRGTLRRTGPATNGTSRGLPELPPFHVPLEKLTDTEDKHELMRSKRILDDREQEIRRALQELGPGSSDEDTDEDGGPPGNPGSSREFSPSPGGPSGGGSARGSRMIERREWGHEEDSHGNHYDDPSGDDYGRGGGRYHRSGGSGSNDDDDD